MSWETFDFGGGGEGWKTGSIKGERPSEYGVPVHLSGYLRLEVVIMLAIGHLDERVGEVCLPGLLLCEPDFMKALPTDATTQVSMKLGRIGGVWSAK